MKIDIEPPFPGGSSSLIKNFFWILKYVLRKGKNNEYFKKKIESLNDVIVSGFSFPLFLRKRYGHYDFGGKKTNFIGYISFFPKVLRSLARVYYGCFAKKSDFIALGCLSKGIYGDEPVYENVKEFKKDLKIVKNGLVIFNLRGLLKRKEFLEFANSCFSKSK